MFFVHGPTFLYSATGHFVIVIPACLSRFMGGRSVLEREGALHLYSCLGYHRYQPSQPSWGEAAWELANGQCLRQIKIEKDVIRKHFFGMWSLSISVMF